MQSTRLIAVASLDEEGLAGEVSGHFGRCPFYTLVRVEDAAILDVDAVPNPHFESHIPGVMPRYIQSLGAEVILAGGMGPKAIQMFNTYGIEVVTGTIGRVSEVLNAYLNGGLSGTVPCAHDHTDSCGGHGEVDHG